MELTGINVIIVGVQEKWVALCWEQNKHACNVGVLGQKHTLVINVMVVVKKVVGIVEVVERQGALHAEVVGKNNALKN
jgi:hypothetical protein